MKKVFNSILGGSFEVRKGEWLLTLLMFTNYYFILLTYYLLKPARDSLFLVKVSPLELPLVFIITALVTVPVVTLYSKAGRSIKLHKLVNITTIVLIINLLALRWLIQRDDPWVYYLFYTWVSIYGALTTSQFWLLGNLVFDAAQAKRIFALLGLGGIVGAITGGKITKLIISSFGISTENLLFFCVGFLAVTIVLVSFIWKVRMQQGKELPSRKKKGGETKESFAVMFGTLKSSKHLKLIVGIIAMTVMVASFVDFQFKFIAKASFPAKDDLTAFFGDFYFYLSFASLGLQGFFTNRFLRKLGVGGVILFLPIGLLIGAATMLLMPGLFAAVILRGSDGAMRYSVDKTGKELLFMPVPIEVKRRLKILIDIFVDRWFRGIAGGLLLLCTMVLELSISQITYVVLVFIVIWISIALLMRKEYVNTFRQALEERRIDLNELRLNVNDAQSLNALIVSLGSTSERHINYALNMLTSVTEKGLKWPIKPLLQHKSDEVKLNALKVLHNLGDESDIADVEPLLKDANTHIRSRAINFIARHSPRDDSAVLKEYLESSDKNVRHAALGCIVEFGSQKEKELITDELINQILSQHGEESEIGRLEVAKALGVIESPDLSKYIKTLLDDSSREVVAETIRSIGKQRVREFVPWLINKLSDRDLRSHCRQSLAAFDRRVLGTLFDYLNDEKLPTSMRRHIPRVMAEIPQQETISFLTESLEAQSSWLAYDILKALNRLRADHDNLKFDKKEIDDAVINETRSFYEVLQILQLQNGHDSPACVLLKKSLQERLDANLEQIFRLMGLKYPPDDIYSAYQGIVSKQRKVRANAMEFLDNLLSADIKRYILPIVDEVSPDFIISKGRDLFKFELESEEDGLSTLIRGSNIWLKVCALYNVPQVRTEKLTQLVRDLQNDKDPMVRETARLVLNKIES